MLKKRGFLSFFMVIGISIVLLLMFFLILRTTSMEADRGKETQKITEFTETAPLMKGYLERCLKETLEDSLAYQGGYGSIGYGLHEDALGETAILYSNGSSYLPSMQAMLDEVGDYAAANMELCVEKLDVRFDGEISSTNVVAREGKVIIDAESSYQYSAGGSSADINQLHAETEFDYPKIYGLVNTIIQKEVEDPDWIPMSDLLDSGYSTELVTYDNNTIVYEITDNNTWFDDEMYVYRFGNVFGGST